MSAHNVANIFASAMMSAILLTACGSAAMQKISGQKKTDDSAQQVTASISLSHSAAKANLADSFDLASVSDFTYNVISCASGYTVTAASAGSTSTSVKLYKGDHLCAAALTSFVYNTATYNKQGGGSLSTGSATFVNQADVTDLLDVTLLAQFPDPVTDAALASFVFHEIKAGTAVAVTGYTYTDTLEVKGVKAPNFSLSSVGLASINSGTGEGTFSFIAQCGRAMTVVATHNVCEPAAGDNQKLTDMKVKLLYDDPAVYTGHNMTYAQAASVMAAGTTTLTDSTLDVSTSNGGFLSNLAGAGQLYTHKDMFLVISYTDPAGYGTSYRYFSVTIGDPQ